MNNESKNNSIVSQTARSHPPIGSPNSIDSSKRYENQKFHGAVKDNLFSPDENFTETEGNGLRFDGNGNILKNDWNQK